MAKANVKIISHFTNQANPSSQSVGAFITDYMLRAHAVEPIVTSNQQQNDYLALLSNLTAPDDSDAVDLLNHRLKFSGVGFSLDQLTLSRDGQRTLAQDCQAAYDRGGTVRQAVISFDTDYLKSFGVIDQSVQEPVLPGDFRGKVDQRRLRQAVTDGLSGMLDQTTMHQPQAICAIQTDAMQVHVHLSIWDRDPKVKNDRGFLNQHQKAAFVEHFDETLSHTRPHVLSAGGLRAIAQSTQNNARFKRTLLADQLYQSALRLDRPSLNEYVKNLAVYDQKTLSQKQRDHVAKRITHDWREQGRSDKRSHTLSLGQRRTRRQISAMVRVTTLRDEIRNYNRYQSANQAVSASDGVKQALQFELQHQLQIVEKYRHFQRPRVEAIYEARQEQLTTRRDALLKKRQALLPQLGAQPLRQRYIASLLKQPDIMQSLARQNHGNLRDSRPLMELRQAQSDGTTPLSHATVHAVTHDLPEKQAQTVSEKLTRNQQIKPQGMTSGQRVLLANYLNELDEYETDAVCWGGLSAKQLSNGNVKSLQTLPVPAQTQSIYERPLLHDDPDLMACDVHQVMSRGSLPPQVELAMCERLDQRYALLKKASTYFTQSHQAQPEWLTYAKQDLSQQFKMADADGLAPAQPKSAPVEQLTGYVLNEQQQKSLVNQHLKAIDRMKDAALDR